MTDSRVVVECTIPGEPHPYERPGVNRQTGAMYTQKGTRQAMAMVASHLKAACRWPERSIDVEVWLTFRRSGRGAVDVDNLAKTVLDACKGVVWKDDAQVVALHVVKVLGCGADAGTDIRVCRVLRHEVLLRWFRRMKSRFNADQEDEG